MKRIISIENRVRWIFKNYPECRNDKNKLIDKYVELYYKGNYIRATHDHAESSILRAGRHIQNTLHEFESNEKVKNYNRKLEREYKNYYKNKQ